MTTSALRSCSNHHHSGVLPDLSYRLEGGTIERGRGVSRALKLTTIYTRLAQGIEEDELGFGQAVSLAPEEIRAIERTFRHLMQDDPVALKPVFEDFDDRNDYRILSCVPARVLSREPDHDVC